MPEKCKTILIVEDDIEIQKALQAALQFEGYHVATAINGKEGLEILQALEGPCLVLLDMMMPVMNGWTFLKTKKEKDILASIPVIVVSAIADRQSITDVQGFIKKPIDLDILLKVVKNYCG